MVETLSGHCLCGSLAIKATPLEKHLAACHCEMCRQWCGGPFIAVHCEPDIIVDNEECLGIYDSSQWAERLFCKDCGTNIAYRTKDKAFLGVSAQLFKQCDDYPIDMQYFIDSKPSNYSFAEKSKTITGEEVFAMFATQGEVL